MFLHIGESRIVFLNEIIGIFNLGSNEDNKQFLESAADESELKRRDYENDKSFVVTSESVYFSPISSSTLAKREEK